ncbi:MAG: NAD(+)/NADH kinase [Candidatus Zixiibacteriota bacterium]
MQFGLVANLKRPGAAEAIDSFIRWSHEHHEHLTLSEELRQSAADYPHFAPASELPDLVDVIVAMGGDGTILATARSVGSLGTPILGINLGSLGFLTQQTPGELVAALNDIVAGRFKIEERILLKAGIAGRPPLAMPYALNDIVLDHGGTTRVLDINLRINDEDVVSYMADGLIIATPTGSTAYNLAVGGPIVCPNMDAMIASPIAAFSLTTRPMILCGRDQLEMSITTPGRKAQLTLDGQVNIDVREGEKVTVERADFNARFVVFPENSFYKLLRRKLHWGVSPEP